MLFTSFNYLVFFSVVLALYWALPYKRARVWLLVIASFAFYASWNRKLAILITLTTVMDYVIALGLDRYVTPWVRKGLLVFSLLVNIGILIYFKYANFFLDSLSEALHAAGASYSLPLLQVILPIGISFYTFEAINYVVDVYRRTIRAERSLANFMLFILFFPHLVAGPIVRARDFLPQTTRTKHWSWLRAQLGVEMILLGLCKKLVIADRMAEFADPLFAAPGDYSTLATWLGVIAYALQIYCDFSGYTDMAIGSAHLLGYKLAQNFNMPYLASSLSDFWRRWHISLSTWLRDYLFIPLGGSRGGLWNTCRNLMLTMLLGGLWHGANWTFVVWGGYHGLLLSLHHVWKKFRASRTRDVQGTNTAIQVGCVAATFVAVCVGWVFFRSQSLGEAFTLLGQMFSLQAGRALPGSMAVFVATVALVVVGHVLGSVHWRPHVGRFFSAPALGAAYAVALSAILITAADGGKTFIYFQF